MAAVEASSAIWRRHRHIALPTEHGAWVFLLSPLIIGLAAGGFAGLSSVLLIVAALAAFLARQPLTIAVKAYSGRRSRQDLIPARFWLAVYTLAGVTATAGLVALGHAEVLWLAVPGIPVFAWHLWLVSRRAERRQMGVEVVAAGALALAAPAAVWVGRGTADPAGLWLWVLSWLQSAASIVYAYLRLEQRTLPAVPAVDERVRLGRRALLYTTTNLIFVGALALAGVLPRLLPLPYALQWLETLWGTLRPAVGVRPTAIGVRQLVVSTLFTVLFVLVWRL
jgi:hypothetical protein